MMMFIVIRYRRRGEDTCLARRCSTSTVVRSTSASLSGRQS